MKNKIFSILKKELREVFRDKKSLSMMLIIPIMIPLLVIGMSSFFDYQINKNDIAVYRSGNKRLKVVSSHNITSIDRYEGRSLAETVNVTAQGNGVYLSGNFSRNIEDTTSGWLTERYFVVHYDNGKTEKVYWEK